METDLYEADITPLYLDSLGIIASLNKELRIAEKIDKRLYNNDKRRIVTPGKAVEAMILNSLGFANRALYLTPHFFQNKPISILLGENITSDDLNDYTLGHTLDEISDYGCTKLFSEIVFEIALEKNLLNDLNSVDTTTFSFHGNYNNNGSLTKELEDPTRVNITHGYSKDKRPDLKQITLSMVMNHKLNIPLWMECLDGNSSDKKSLQDTIEQVNKFSTNLNLKKPFRWIADSALYNKNKLLKSNEFVWLTRIPNTLKESKSILSEASKTLKWKSLNKDYKYVIKDSNCGGIKQKWILIYSESKYQTEKRKFDELYKKEKKSIEELQEKYKERKYKTEETCKKQIENIPKAKRYHSIEIKILKSGKSYKLDIKYSLKREAIEKKKISLGRFILGTNDVKGEFYNPEEILSIYKSQQNIERGFRFLKDPYFMSDTFYLKKEGRITSLLMLMTLTLLIYNYGQNKLRTNLQRSNLTLPNQKKVEIKTPTLKWIFQLMTGILVLVIKSSKGEKKMITKLNSTQKKIISLLCDNQENLYNLKPIEINSS